MLPRNHRTLVPRLLLTALLLLLPARAAAQQPAAPPQPSQPAAAADELWITVRLAPGVSAETLALLNQITQPKKRTVKQGESLSEVLKDVYGDASERFEGLVRKLNPDEMLSRIKAGAGGELALPAAPDYDLTVFKSISSAEDLRTVALRETGSADAGRLKAIRKYTSELRSCVSEGKCRSFEEVRLMGRRNVVALPFSSRYVSFPLKAAGAGELTAALARLAKSEGVTDIEVHDKLRLIPPISLSRAQAIRDGCVNDPSGLDWPLRHMSLNKVLVEELAAAAPAATTVAILDSGIVKDDARFSLSLWKNDKEEGGRDAVDEDENRYYDDKIGYDFINKEPFPLDEHFDWETGFSNHGTHVAGLAGGVFVEQAPPEVFPRVLAEAGRRVRLMILKIAYDNGDVEPGALFEALDYAREKGAPVVNMSFASASFNKALMNRMLEYNHILFVAAAGNVGQDLDVANYYPAKFSKDVPNMISVAAHGEMLERPCFSNYGAQTIDLAAPGVQVQSTVKGGYTKTNGTSQAAPLVSLTAAVLNATGLTGPARIRQRILASVDFVPALRNELSSGGVLNVAKALAFRHDLIELNDAERTLLHGRIVGPPAQLTIGDRSVAFADVRKIVTYSPEMGATLQRVTVLSGGRLEHVYGALTMPTIKIKEPGKERCTEVAFDSVRDLIPASVPPDSPVTCPE